MQTADMLSSMQTLLRLAEQEVAELSTLCGSLDEPSATRIRHIIQSAETANRHLQSLQAIAVDLRSERKL